MQILLILPILLALFLPAAAGTGTDEFSRNGAVSGVVLNRETGAPVGWSSILIEEAGRSITSHSDGTFIILNIPEGTYTLRVYRVGYERYSTPVTVTRGDTTEVTLRIRETVFRSQAVEITSRRHNDRTTETSMVISGRQLRQQLSRTISETLINEPGMNQQSMGPAPARPVMRGLGGERLLILEDGRRTGDLSATSADHAVSIESMTADQIEITRGPSALIYGSNTIGGVINVIRGQIPRQVPEHLHGSVSTQLESVNLGATGGLNITGGTGPFAFRMDGSVRNARDIQTPEGELDNTSIETYNGSLGVSYIRSWGSVGISGSVYDIGYGIPGGFMGGHPKGVQIEMLRRFTQFQFDYTDVGDFFRRLELEGNYAYYLHRELEFPERLQGRSILGSEFGVLTTNLRFNAHHYGILGDRGLAGMWAEHRDYATGGGFFTPATIERAAAAYLYEHFTLGDWNLESALRYDFRAVSPREPSGEVQERLFSGFSGSVSATYNFDFPLQLGSTVMRSYRAPGIEELFSDGPHVAAYSFEVGNPDLNAESGFGLEFFAKYSTTVFRGHASVFRNQFSGFIYPENTGEPSTRRNDLLVYRYEGVDALMTGAEVSYEWNFLPKVVSSGTLSYVRGDIVRPDETMPFVQINRDFEPLPMVPPLSGTLGLEYRRTAYSFGANSRFAFDQTRTGQFEENTTGFVILNLSGEYHFHSSHFLHTFSLSVENVFDESYRMHLSRIKSIMPEPGRNVKLLYRVYF